MTAPPEGELGAFGFEDEQERGEDGWLERFRRADEARPSDLGSIGPYVVLAEVDRGGQGVVYRARQPGTDREVALKRLRAGVFASATMRRRFEREVEAVVKLSHPGIVPLHAVDEIDGVAVLAMEWVDGVSLTEWSSGRSTDEIVDMMIDVGAAVHHAHQRGVIHRDLKPSNILVDPSGAPRVLDFGLAKLDGDDSALDDSASGHFVGTPAYAAPEQAAGDHDAVDVRTDVHALGVLLYLMVEGELPYPPEPSLIETLRRVRDDPPPRARSAPPELAAVIACAIAKAPDDRYPSVEALRSDLERMRRGEPVSARQHSTLSLGRFFVRRHRVACAVAVGVVLLTVGFMAALATQVGRAQDSRRVAERVSAFLLDTLSGVGPAGLGGDFDLRALLEDADRRARAELDGDPEVAAEVHHTLGTIEISLWNWAQASAHLERATALRRTLGDPESLASTLTAWGRALASLRDERAESVLTEALSIRRSLHGDRHPFIAETRMRLGYALYLGTDPPRETEAERELAAALSCFRETVGPAHRDLASCLHIYGYLRIRQGRRDDAYEMYTEALEIFHALGDARDPYFGELVYGHVALLSALERHDEIVQLLDESLSSLQRLYGRSKLGFVYRVYARALHEVDDDARAAAQLQRWVQVLLERLAENEPGLAPELRTLAARIEAERLDATGLLPRASLAALAERLEQPRELRQAILLYDRVRR